MKHKKIALHIKLQFSFLKVSLLIVVALLSHLFSFSQILYKQTIGENITPKSIIHDGRGLFSAQNMMYTHTVSLYSSDGVLLKTIPDVVNLHNFGYKEYENTLYRGAPVEACFTPDGKYLWVSNYAMYGPGFNNVGCDGCSGDNYDSSFLYKININTYMIESVVKVGSVPKYLTISNNGKLLLVSNWTSSDVSIIDLESEKEIRRVKVGSRPRGIAINKINQKAYVAIMGSNKIAIINLLDFSVKYIDNVGKAPRHLILNSDNSLLFATVNSANKIVKIDLKSNKITQCRTSSGPRSMILSPDEKFLYVVNYYANTFQKIDTESMFVLETVKTLQKPIGIAGDWNNGNIWVSCYSGKIIIYHDQDIASINKTEVDYLTSADIRVDIDNKKNNPVIQNSKTIQPNEVANENCQYNVIVGSFSISKNAQHLQELLITLKLASTTLSPLNRKMIMVSVGSYNNSYMAANQMRILKLEHDLNTWIYKGNCNQ